MLLSYNLMFLIQGIPKSKNIYTHVTLLDDVCKQNKKPKHIILLTYGQIHLKLFSLQLTLDNSINALTTCELD